MDAKVAQTPKIVGLRIRDSYMRVFISRIAYFRDAISTPWEVNGELHIEIAQVIHEGIRDKDMTDVSICLGLHTTSSKVRSKWFEAAFGNSWKLFGFYRWPL
jgi:hypothetical protein